MAVRPKGEKRKRRCVMATDSEWALIRQRADAEGLTISEYTVRALLAGREPEGSGGGLPPTLARRQLRAVLVLEHMERHRLEELGAGHVWRELLAEVDARLDEEDGLGG